MCGAGGVSAAAQPLSSRAESGGSSEGAKEAREEREHRSSSMPKADAWKEKNRLAQRAFRQRQKVRTPHHKFTELGMPLGVAVHALLSRMCLLLRTCWDP